MIKSKHISENELLELLHGDGESDKTRSLGQHLHECQLCQEALESLTAKSAIWQKAPEMLREKSMTDSISDRSMSPEATRAFPGPGPAETEQPEWQYAIDQILDPPRHPEMLGRVGKYDIEREIGRGGMGVVLKAHDAELNRPLAIKILAPHLASHGTA